MPARPRSQFLMMPSAALLAFSLIMTFILAAGPLAMAVEGNPDGGSATTQATPEKIERIKGVCKDVQITLNQVHVNDALARVNLGRRYEDVSSKLMAPFNSRAVGNGLDAAHMVSTTTDYNKNLQKFRLDYQAYEEAMAQAIAVDCEAHPDTFYNMVTTARHNRLTVGKAVGQLNADLKQYTEEFQSLKSSVANVKRTK